jgi:hypothetical protein
MNYLGEILFSLKVEIEHKDYQLDLALSNFAKVKAII